MTCKYRRGCREYGEEKLICEYFSDCCKTRKFLSRLRSSPLLDRARDHLTLESMDLEPVRVEQYPIREQ